MPEELAKIKWKVVLALVAMAQAIVIPLLFVSAGAILQSLQIARENQITLREAIKPQLERLDARVSRLEVEQ